LVTTEDGSLTMRHAGHGECFHSDFGAELEAQSLYVGASGLRDRLAEGGSVRVLDVGLGLGLNALATIEAWLGTPTAGDLVVTSLEIDEELVRGLASSDAPWTQAWTAERKMLARSIGSEIVHSNGSTARWLTFLGDAAASNARWRAEAPREGYDFVWQDAFSPANNPTLWSAAWFATLRTHAAPGAVLMTYSVAGAVRAALAASGWTWTKIPTPAPRKRNWLRAETAPC